MAANKRWVRAVGLGVVAVLAVIGGLWGGVLLGTQLDQTGDGAASLAQPVMAQEADAVTGNRSADLVVDARLFPAQQAQVGFAVGGVLIAVEVREGDLVEAGQVLARLDSAQQQTAVSRARAELARAEARLAEVRAGARGEEIESAQAALAAAQARLLRLEAGSLPNEVAAAQANVAAAQANLNRVLEGPSEPELIAARADVANAEAAVAQAQAAYDQVKWRADIGALPQSADLERATNNLTAARARLADLDAGARQADIDAANAEIRRASAQLTQLQASLPADVAAAQADVRQFQAQLDLLLAGSRPEQIAAAEADVAAATAVLQQALVAVAETELRAPFAGTIAQLDVSVGEQVQPGVAILDLADLTGWEIRTEDLTELDVIHIAPGDRVSIRFDAIPDLELVGHVDRIRTVGADQRGDIVYTAFITPAETDPRLLWNMTAVVRFTLN